MTRASFNNASLLGADLKSVQLQGANLISALMQGADLTWSQLQETNLVGADLRGAVLGAALLQGANLNSSQMQGASLKKVNAQGASFINAFLQGADLSPSQFQGADFSQAYMQGVDLSFSQIQGANLRDAQLQGAVCFGVPEDTGMPLLQRSLTDHTKFNCRSGEAFAALQTSEIDRVMITIPDLSEQEQTTMRKQLSHPSDFEGANCTELTADMVANIEKYWSQGVPDDITEQWSKNNHQCL